MVKRFNDHERKKLEQQIFEEYKQTLIETPHNKISVQTLATKVGIAKRTFYLLFESKESLFLKMMTEALEQLKQIILEPTAHVSSSKQYFLTVMNHFSVFASNNQWLIHASGTEYQQALAKII